MLNLSNDPSSGRPSREGAPVNPASLGPAFVHHAFPSVRTDGRLHKLWLAMQRRAWSSLAVVAASRSVDTLEIAELFAKLAWWYGGQASCVFDLRDLSFRLVEYHQREVHAQAAAGSCVVMALRPMGDNPTTIPMAHSADAVVLCVDLGKAHLKAVAQTLSAVGRGRVLGSIVLGEGTARGAT
jgi:hypothetical protein